MELFNLKEDIKVFGVHVNTFPNGIGDAFGSLMKIFGANRSYYGISWIDENDNIVYYAMAQEAINGEAEQQSYSYMTIEKGEYLTETIHKWLEKTDQVKDVFHQLMGNKKPDKKHPCIEWYKSDEEMVCMILNNQ